MSHRLCILVCEHLAPEAAAVAAGEGFGDVLVCAFPARCGRPALAWDELVAAAGGHGADVDRVVVLGGECCRDLAGTPGPDRPPFRVDVAVGCPQLLVNQATAASLQQSGAYLISPGWLTCWRRHMERWGFDQATAREFFGECTDRLLLLDSGVREDTTDLLGELAEFVDLPAEVLPVGLEVMRLHLSNLVLGWRLERASPAPEAEQQTAELAMGMDQIVDLAAAKTEAEAMERICTLFSMLFSPRRVACLAIIDGEPRLDPAAPPLEAEAQGQLASLTGDYQWTPSGDGFLLRIEHRGIAVGAVMLDGLACPRHKERYLNLALGLASVCGLAVANARSSDALREAGRRTRLEGEKQLASSEARYRAIVESLDDGFLVVDADARIEFASRRAAELLGHDGPEELVGLQGYSFIAADDQNEALRILGQVTETTGSRRHEIQARRRDGTIFFAEAQGVLLEGTEIKIAVSFRDITERRRREDRLSRRTSLQEILGQILQRSQTDLTLGQILQFALDRILSLGWLSLKGTGAIFVADEGADRLVMVAQSGLEEPVAETCASVPAGRCLCGRAFQRQEIVFAGAVDERHEIQFPGMDPHGHYCVPILDGEAAVGLLNLYLPPGRGRHEDDEAHLGLLAEVLGGVIAHKQTEQRRRQSEARYRELVESIHEVFFAGTWQGDSLKSSLTFVSPQVEELFGLGQDELLANPGAWFDCIHPGDRARVAQLTEVARSSGQPTEREYRVLDHRSGRCRWIEDSFFPTRDAHDAEHGFFGVARDISERKQAELDLRGLNRALRMISTCNKALVQARAEDVLLRRICAAMVEIGGYRLCWVGIVDQDEAGTVRPVAHAGEDAGYIEKVRITLSDPERRRGPVGRAIRQGEPVVLDDVGHDPSFAPWRDEAQRRGFSTIIALPLTVGGRVIGALAAYSGEGLAIGEGEVALLVGLANDLSYGIGALRGQAERERVEAELARHREHLEQLVQERTAELERVNRDLLSETEASSRGAARFDAILSASMDGFWLADMNGGILEANPAICELWGYSRDEVLTMNISDTEAAETPE